MDDHGYSWSVRNARRWRPRRLGDGAATASWLRELGADLKRRRQCESVWTMVCRREGLSGLSVLAWSGGVLEISGEDWAMVSQARRCAETLKLRLREHLPQLQGLRVVHSAASEGESVS